MNKRNYQKELDKVIEGLDHRPSLLLHSCCGPCSSYVLSYLSRCFDITLLYYNPNIYPPQEFDKRAAEQERLISELNSDLREYDPDEDMCVLPADAPDIRYIKGTYDPDEFFDIAKGLEDVKEGGARCYKCYELRLKAAADEAAKGGYEYFTTTRGLDKRDRGEDSFRNGSQASAVRFQEA